MTDIRFSAATTAYKKSPTPEKALDSGSAAAGGKTYPSFSDLVSNAAEDAVSNLKQSEHMSMQAATGKAEITDVVTAVTQAEITLQTVMSIRDTLVDSFKRIMQMPI